MCTKFSNSYQKNTAVMSRRDSVIDGGFVAGGQAALQVGIAQAALVFAAHKYVANDPCIPLPD